MDRRAKGLELRVHATVRKSGIESGFEWFDWGRHMGVSADRGSGDIPVRCTVNGGDGEVQSCLPVSRLSVVAYETAFVATTGHPPDIVSRNSPFSIRLNTRWHCQGVGLCWVFQ